MATIWDCKKNQYLDERGGKKVCRPRKEIMEHPPSTLVVELPISKKRKTMKGVSNQLRKDYGLDFGYSEDAEGFEQIFYNSDLRSQCGELLEWDDEGVYAALRTKYWVDWQPEWMSEEKRVPDERGYYTRMYRKVVAKATSVRAVDYVDY